MEQSDLWDETIFDALGGAVQAAGGTKRVAAKLWPTLDPTTAASRLRGALNTEHVQKLDPDEFVAIGAIGKEAGTHRVMEFLARAWGYEVRPLAPEETKKAATRARRLALLDELKRLEDSE